MLYSPHEEFIRHRMKNSSFIVWQSKNKNKSALTWDTLKTFHISRLLHRCFYYHRLFYSSPACLGHCIENNQFSYGTASNLWIMCIYSHVNSGSPQKLGYTVCHPSQSILHRSRKVHSHVECSMVLSFREYLNSHCLNYPCK